MNNLVVTPALSGHIMLHSIRNSGKKTLNGHIFQMIWRQLSSSSECGIKGHKSINPLLPRTGNPRYGIIKVREHCHL